MPRTTETFVIVLMVAATLLFLVARTPPAVDPFELEPLTRWNNGVSQVSSQRTETVDGAHVKRLLHAENTAKAIRALQRDALSAGWTLTTTSQALADVDFLAAQKTLPDGSNLTANAKIVEETQWGSGKLLLVLSAVS